jgi:hypothetical protein
MAERGADPVILLDARNLRFGDGDQHDDVEVADDGIP